MPTMMPINPHPFHDPSPRPSARTRNSSNALRVAALTCCALVFAVACARAQPFVPGERVTAISAQGYLAAEYEVPHTGGAADIKVWSRGTSRETLRGPTETFAHVAFEIDNQTQQSMQLLRDRLVLQSASIDGAELESVPPALIEGATTVGPGSEHAIDVWFALPEGVAPRDVSAFRVAWTISDGTTSYTQRTPFLQEPSRYYYSPYYDPFVYDPVLLHRGVIIHRHPYYYRPGPARRLR